MGDTAYFFMANQDNYPLMQQFTIYGLPTTEPYVEPIPEPVKTETGGGSTATVPEEIIDYLAESTEEPVANIPAVPLTEETPAEAVTPETLAPAEAEEIAEPPVENLLGEQSIEATATGTGAFPALIAIAVIAMIAAGILLYKRKR